MSFTARFWGTCQDCLEPIQPGDAVHYDRDPMGFAEGDRLVHDDCYDSTSAADRPREVCASCFLERPCSCDDEKVSA